MRWLLPTLIMAASSTTLLRADEPREEANAPLAVLAESLFLCDPKQEEMVIIVGPDGAIRVTQNGQEVPADRLQRDGNRIIVRTAQGDGTANFMIARGGAGAIASAPAAPAAGVTKRKRIGITMVPVDPALCEHLELSPDQVVMIGDVADGMPASRAGLQKHDIVVALNDSPHVTAQTIHELIQATAPGHELRLRVLRRGVPHDTQVTVEEVEALAPVASGEMLLKTVPFLRGSQLMSGAQVEAVPLEMLQERLRAIELAEVQARASGGPSGIFTLRRHLESTQADHERAQAERTEARAQAEAKAADSGMKRVEERLARLEKMLEQLLQERTGGVR